MAFLRFGANLVLKFEFSSSCSYFSVPGVEIRIQCIEHNRFSSASHYSIQKRNFSLVEVHEKLHFYYFQPPYGDEIRIRCIEISRFDSASQFSHTTLCLGFLFYTPEQEESQYGKSLKTRSPTDGVVKPRVVHILVFG